VSTVSQQHIRELPIVVLLPHNRCNCRCVMCDIWKIGQVREITEKDLEPHLCDMRTLKVKWVVLSGGEPLLHSGLPALCSLLRRDGIRVTLLTAGLNLEQHARTVTPLLDDFIVSIDGPPDIHDAIRGVPGAYLRLARGIQAVRRVRPDTPVNGRCTVQKRNVQELYNTVGSAHALGLNSLSFLAADLTSSAFNRPDGWSSERQNGIALTADEVVRLDREIERVIASCARDFESGFITEAPAKLRRIGLHFRAHLGMVPMSPPRCNAPWVSTVIEADGTVKPCFFHPPIGNIHDLPLHDILNGEAALKFRQHLDVSTDPTCRNCVCSLFIPQSGEA
jgi:MoaA/NifB/PqqE/SkfB family radical SAM enzyme